MANYNVLLDKPFGKQAEIISSPAKRKLIVAGRRFGKTTTTAIIASKAILEGKRVLQAAPQFEQTEAFWENCKKYFRELIEAQVMYKHEGQRRLALPNGGRIKSKTAWDAQSLRGDYADLLILEEYSLMTDDTWSEVGAPMLLDNDGDAIFIFTPKRRNHAFRLYQKYNSDQSDRSRVWHFTSYDNPYISGKALEEIVGDMTQEDIEQELMAKFLENEGQVFRNILANMTAPLDAKPSDHKGHRIVGGIDWGKHDDFTAISLGCVDCKVEVARDRFKKIDYIFQRDRIKALVNKWQPFQIMVELNSMGEPNFEQLQEDGLPVVGFKMTGSSKPPLIRGLALSLENKEWQFQADEVWTGELQSYEQRVNKVTNRSSYSAPAGMHDDTAIARALMLEAGRGEHWVIY